MISLKALLSNISVTDWDINITGLCLDHRTIKPGDLFFAYPGSGRDSREFIAGAIENGAVAVLSEAGKEIVSDTNIPIIQIKNLQHKIGLIAAKFYQQPSAKLTVIGITGTNGKTSVCHLLAQALTQLNKKTAIIGTIGNGMVGDLTTSFHTTPDPIKLQSLLAEFVEGNVEVVVMEVSSHALDQSRVAGIEFDYALFTNITRDHLDYHHDMQHYASSKKRLFQCETLRGAVINLDDKYGAEWAQEFAKNYPIMTYALNNSHANATFQAQKTQFNLGGIQAKIITQQDEAYLNSSLLGQHNLSNLLAVLAALNIMGFKFQQAMLVLNNLHAVRGRMQTLGGGDKALVVIDYAHTPDALEKALESLKQCRPKRLICVFGCGGNRDRGKRPQMAQVAEQHADLIVLTSDNPRDEEPEAIIQEIMMGFKNSDLIKVIVGRREAIAYAIKLAQAGDIVLLAGKGHEQYQEIKGRREVLDEVAIAKSFIFTSPLAGEVDPA